MTRKETAQTTIPGRSGKQPYRLRLFVSGATPRCTRAIANVRKICDERLGGQYELEIIDVYQQPEFLRLEQIIATPTLVKVLPAPMRRFIGDLSRIDSVVFGVTARAQEEKRGG